MVQIKLEKIRPITKQTQLLVLGLFEGESELLFKALGHDLSPVLKELVENGEFTSTFGSNYLLPTFGKIGPKRIMLTGLGKKGKVFEGICKNCCWKDIAQGSGAWTRGIQSCAVFCARRRPCRSNFRRYLFVHIQI